jgi:hypothetical protein
MVHLIFEVFTSLPDQNVCMHGFLCFFVARLVDALPGMVWSQQAVEPKERNQRRKNEKV